MVCNMHNDRPCPYGKRVIRPAVNSGVREGICGSGQPGCHSMDDTQIRSNHILHHILLRKVSPIIDDCTLFLLYSRICIAVHGGYYDSEKCNS